MEQQELRNYYPGLAAIVEAMRREQFDCQPPSQPRPPNRQTPDSEIRERAESGADRERATATLNIE